MRLKHGFWRNRKPRAGERLVAPIPHKFLDLIPFLSEKTGPNHNHGNALSEGLGNFRRQIS